MKKIFTLKTTLFIALFALCGFVAKAQTYSEDFETLTKSGYSSERVTLNGFDWNFTGSCAGNLAGDWKVGEKSARLAGTTKEASNSEVSKIEMLANKPGGIGNLSFEYRRYGTDKQISWFVEWSADGTTWTQIGEITGTEEVQKFSYDINQDNARIRIIANGFKTSASNSKRLNIDNMVMTDKGAQSTASMPSLDPASGDYYSSINVTISSKQSGATIYYTTDGTEPNNSGNGTEYTSPIAVSSTTTIKAIAYVSGFQPSPIATETYTFPTVTDVADIATLRNGTPGESYRLTGEAVITLMSSDRNAKYIQDATAAILIDDAEGVITSMYNVNDGIKNLVVKLGSYQKMLQAIPQVDPGAPSSTNNKIKPEVVTLDNLADKQAKLVTITKITISETGTFEAKSNYNISDGTNAGILRTHYSDLTINGTQIPTEAQDITGVVQQYRDDYQIVPITITSPSGIGINSASIKIFASDNQLYIDNDGSAKTIEVYNVLGRKLVDKVATPGLNVVPAQKGQLLIVKAGKKVAKVIVK